MRFTTHTLLDDGVLEREFTLAGFTGILWMPPTATPSSSVPLLLLNQPGGFGTRRMYPRLVARAAAAAAEGFASVTIELPGAGDRPRLPGVDEARADLRAALTAGEPPSADVIDRLILPLVDAAVRDWQSTLDAVLALPEIGTRVGFSGGVIAVGVRLAATDPRIAAAGLFAGSYVPRCTMDEARGIGNTIHVLLQWDDEGNDRQAALDLFDAFASREKTLVANMGAHTGVPALAGEDAGRFFVRHLTSRLEPDVPCQALLTFGRGRRHSSRRSPMDLREHRRQLCAIRSGGGWREPARLHGPESEHGSSLRP